VEVKHSLSLPLAEKIVLSHMVAYIRKLVNIIKVYLWYV